MLPFDLKDATVDQMQWLWNNNGYYTPVKEDSNRVKLTDALAVPNAPLLFPKVIENVVKEAIEPNTIATSLLPRINVKYGQQITFPAMGALTAADIAEGEEYPEVSPSMGGGTVIASVGKVGLALKITEEMIRYSQYDVIGMMLRAAGRALARHKEMKFFNMLKLQGVCVFDNLSPTTSVNGVTNGRDISGSPNGSITMDDIFDGFAQLITQGFTPNTLLMHPLTWVMWIKDPQLRAFVQANGGGTFFAGWTGNPAGRASWHSQFGVSGGQNIIPGQTSRGESATHSETASALLQYPQNINSAPQLPSYMNVPLAIIVSPFVPYNARRKLTDIFMFDRNEVGAYLVDEDLMTEDFDDPARDMRKLKLRERYNFFMAAEGQACCTFKNIHVVPNEIVLPASSTIDVSSALQTITPSTPLSL